MSIVYGVLVVCAVSAAAVAGLALVQRLVSSELRQQHNDVAGFVYAVLGVVYAVLLALVVIAVWEQYQRARATVESEANAVAEIAWLAHGLPDPDRQQLQEHARSYAQEVVNEEWPLMEQGMEQEGRGTPQGWDLIDDMRATLQGVDPVTEAEQAIFSQGLDQVQRLADARRMRLVQAEQGMPAVLWAVLVFGGVVAIGFAYLFGLQNAWAHSLMVVSLASVIALVLFTIGVIEYPFSGGARIGTDAFELILERFKTSKLSDL